MNGVDSLNQRQASFDAGLRNGRNWNSIHHFFLDIKLINTVAKLYMNGSVIASKKSHLRPAIAS